MDSICRESGGLTLPLTPSLSFFFFFFLAIFCQHLRHFKGRNIYQIKLPALVFSAIRAFVFLFFFSPFNQNQNWIQRLRQLPVIFQPAALASADVAANAARLSPRCLLFNSKAPIHLCPQIHRVAHLEVLTSQWREGGRERLQPFGFLSARNLGIVVIESPTLTPPPPAPQQCRRCNAEPLLFTSDPYINTSFQAS